IHVLITPVVQEHDEREVAQGEQQTDQDAQRQRSPVDARRSDDAQALSERARHEELRPAPQLQGVAPAPPSAPAREVHALLLLAADPLRTPLVTGAGFGYREA